LIWKSVIDDTGMDGGYGYYEIREFASMALFFRRYAKGALSTSTPRELLAHLRPGAAVTDNANAGDITGWSLADVTGVDLNMTYMGESWTPATNWNYEYGAYISGSILGIPLWSKGYTNWWKVGRKLLRWMVMISIALKKQKPCIYKLTMQETLRFGL
jgi:hypothetical protein